MHTSSFVHLYKVTFLQKSFYSWRLEKLSSNCTSTRSEAMFEVASVFSTLLSFFDAATACSYIYLQCIYILTSSNSLNIDFLTLIFQTKPTFEHKVLHQVSLPHQIVHARFYIVHAMQQVGLLELFPYNVWQNRAKINFSSWLL